MGIIKLILGNPDSEDADLASEVAHREASALRRLFFESYTTVMATLKLKVEASKFTEPRKLSRAERSQQKEAFNARANAGFRVEGKLEPSDRYMDQMDGILEDEIFDAQLWLRSGPSGFRES